MTDFIDAWESHYHVFKIDARTNPPTVTMDGDPLPAHVMAVTLRRDDGTPQRMDVAVETVRRYENGTIGRDMFSSETINFVVNPDGTGETALRRYNG
jgi:hypothetical protein